MSSIALNGSLPLEYEQRRTINPWIIALVVTMATFMEVLDTTIANVALPHIAGNLGAGQDESTWVLTSYLVSNAIVLPISGWLSRVIGRKRFYMSCVALFTISSLLCGMAPSLGMLIFFRVLQGIGGGGLQPSEQAILVDTFPANKRGMAFALTGIAMISAPVLGPTLGGWITDNYSWRWCFYINAPVGILSLFLTYHLLHEKPVPKEGKSTKGSVDFLGLGLIALGLGCMQFVLDKGERVDWFSSRLVQCFTGLAVIGIVGAVLRELWVEDPVVDLRLLKNRNFAIANLLMFMLGFALFGSTVLLPQMMQTLMGYTATQAGLVISPGGLVVMGMLPIVGFLVSRFQTKWLIVFGAIIVSFSLLVMSGFNLEMSMRTLVLTRCLQTFGIAFLFVPINTTAYSQLPPGKNNNASALINLSRNIGASFGIALTATWLARRTQFHQSRLSERLTSYNPAFAPAVQHTQHALHSAGLSMSDATHAAMARMGMMLQQQASVLAYLDCYRGLAAVLLIILPLALLIKKTKPRNAGGH